MVVTSPSSTTEEVGIASILPSALGDLAPNSVEYGPPTCMLGLSPMSLVCLPCVLLIKPMIAG